MNKHASTVTILIARFERRCSNALFDKNSSSTALFDKHSSSTALFDTHSSSTALMDKQSSSIAQSQTHIPISQVSSQDHDINIGNGYLVFDCARLLDTIDTWAPDHTHAWVLLLLPRVTGQLSASSRLRMATVTLLPELFSRSHVDNEDVVRVYVLFKDHLVYGYNCIIHILKMWYEFMCCLKIMSCMGIIV